MALNGDPDPKSAMILTSKACEALQLVEEKLTEAKVIRIDYNKPLSLLIIRTEYTQTGCLWQDGVLEWIHLPHTNSRINSAYDILCAALIVKARNRSKEIFGRDMQEIVVP